MHRVLKNLSPFLSDSAETHHELYSIFVNHIKVPCCYRPKSGLNYMFLNRRGFISLVGIIHSPQYVLSLLHVFKIQREL